MIMFNNYFDVFMTSYAGILGIDYSKLKSCKIKFILTDFWKIVSVMGVLRGVFRWLIIACAFVILLGGVWQLLKPGAGCRSPGSEAPNFSLRDLDGRPFQLKDFRGKVVLLDFMATWCGPCRASMPGLKVLWEEYGGRIVLISISVDPVYDTEDRLRSWVRGGGATWIHARDTMDPPLAQIYGVTGIPTYVIIDKDGCVRYRHVGLTSEGVIRGEIEALLKG